MGRSGTSALTNTLALCGAQLPDNLLGPHESNAKGHFEPNEALFLDIEFLKAFGSEWDDPTFRVPFEVDTAQEGEAFVERLTGFLDSYKGRSPLVVKEPRITVLSRFWFDAAARSGW